MSRPIYIILEVQGRSTTCPFNACCQGKHTLDCQYYTVLEDQGVHTVAAVTVYLQGT